MSNEECEQMLSTLAQVEDDIKRLKGIVCRLKEQIRLDDNPILKKPIDSCVFGKNTTKIQNSLRGTIVTIGDLVNCTPRDLLCFRNFGKGCLIEVEEYLASHNLSLFK